MVIEVFNLSYGYIKSQGPLKSKSRCSIIKNKWNNDSPLFLAGNHSHRTEPVADIVFFIFSRQYEERQLRSQQERAQRRLEFSNQESRLMNQVGKKCYSTHILFNLPN